MKKFDKKELSKVLSHIIMDYKSLNEFGKISGISPSYISKLINYKIKNAPEMNIIKKIVDNSNGKIGLIELLVICGHIEETYIESHKAYVSTNNNYELSNVTPDELDKIKSFLLIIRKK